MSILLQTPFPSRLPHHIEHNSKILFGYSFKIYHCVHVDSKLPNCLFPLSFPLTAISLLSKSVSLLLYCIHLANSLTLWLFMSVTFCFHSFYSFLFYFFIYCFFLILKSLILTCVPKHFILF